ncbi:MAG: hypothetical protein DMG78_00530, partial [Acidobacteria bacterium]
EGDGFSCAATAEINSETNTQKAATNAVFFMRLFYQNQSEAVQERLRRAIQDDRPIDPARFTIFLPFLPIFKGVSTWPRFALIQG